MFETENHGDVVLGFVVKMFSITCSRPHAAYKYMCKVAKKLGTSFSFLLLSP